MGAEITSGTNGDAFPNDASQCNDTDGDGTIRSR